MRNADGGAVKVMAVAGRNTLSFVNPTAQRALYQPRNAAPDLPANGARTYSHSLLIKN